MKKVSFFYDDVFLRHETPKFHPECKERLEVIVNTLRDSEIWGKLIHEKPRKATSEELKAAHSAQYVDRMAGFTGYFDPDTFISDGSYEAALYAAGAVLRAVELAKEGKIERAFCAVRPPGHHAEKDRAMGFCIFNNVAVGARYAQKVGFKRVFIADFDVHHGNGTQHIFEDDPDVFYFSTHQYPHYPGTGSESEVGRGAGQGATYNVPMPPGSGDKEYIAVYQNVLPPVVARFRPDIMLVSAGYDIYRTDPLAAIRVTDEGIVAIVRGILTAASGIPAIFTLEGGYDLSNLGRLVLLTVKELLEAD